MFIYPPPPRGPGRCLNELRNSTTGSKISTPVTLLASLLLFASSPVLAQTGIPLVDGLIIDADSLLTSTNSSPIMSMSIDNYVTSTIAEGRPWWDPQNPLTISGVLLDHEFVACSPGPAVANVDSIIVVICPPLGEGEGENGHHLCGEVPVQRGCGGFRQAFSPGTDSSGRFEVTIIGGGVSFLAAQDPRLGDGSIIDLYFVEGDATPWLVRCGIAARGPFCSSAPDIYGRLSSPDLNGNGFTDSQDFGLFSRDYFGKPATPSSGWQADYNQSGYVDSGDFGLFGGRYMSHCSGSSKSGGISYDMNVQNLTDPVIVEGMSLFGVTSSQIIAYWDEMGLSYDQELAGEILSSSAASVQRLKWGAFKRLYEDATE